ncbi:YitT family protein [Massilicoli timonensis]|uniref:YitT family protein n=1 Tax=Massilicoli timonensis TaxID=2015901 RepID=UPI0023F53783|nr:YitT family protein [Massilicoli timonensis]
MFGLNQVKNIVGILAGNTLYALAVVLFIVPNELITGGTTGMGLLFEQVLGVPLTLFVSLFNIAMFLLGFWVLGKQFALTTLISSFYYPFILSILQGFLGNEVMTQDRLLSCILAGLMIGAAIGIVIRCGASTGGMDIPPLVLHKKMGISVSLSMYAFDFVILLGQMVIREREMVLYGILLVLIYTVVLDKVLVVGKSQIQVKIISKEYERINEMIIHQLDRGTTLMHAETGFKHSAYPVILSVVSPRELALLCDRVHEIDADAFMIIHQVNEVKGRGFSMAKHYE